MFVALFVAYNAPLGRPSFQKAFREASGLRIFAISSLLT
jgi:hypothetical protein